MVEGRAISKLTEATQKGMGEEDEKMVVMMSMIGSRPPKCERRCNSCGHCEAVQVPVTTQAQGRRRSHFSQVDHSRVNDQSYQWSVSGFVLEDGKILIQGGWGFKIHQAIFHNANGVANNLASMALSFRRNGGFRICNSTLLKDWINRLSADN
ncbi:hypothetical protein LWI29_016529 [Acer saccharum]|uniref:Epidermal patterning factor-like protein n=1 Tax=Acer saccharum TaxID=4024 RepID=A0AA39RM42_ACESA|nr:hypothetical protein LWI29_016529 [Acer saccharum]